METLLLNRINKIELLLKEHISKFYEKNVLPAPPVHNSQKDMPNYPSVTNIESQVNYYDSTPETRIGLNAFQAPYYYFPPQQQVVVVNNGPTHDSQRVETTNNQSEKKEKKEKKQDDDKNDKLMKYAAGGALVGLSFAGTWFLTNDEYVKFIFSDIDKEIMSIQQLLKELYNYQMIDYSQHLQVFIERYNEWKNTFSSRVKSKLFSKVGCLASGAAVLASAFFPIAGLFTGGIIAGTLCGSYVLGKNLLENKVLEEDKYKQVMVSIDNVKSLLSYKQNLSNFPTAPI